MAAIQIKKYANYKITIVQYLTLKLKKNRIAKNDKILKSVKLFPLFVPILIARILKL